MGVALSGPLEGFAVFPHLSFSSAGTGLPSPFFFFCLFARSPSPSTSPSLSSRSPPPSSPPFFLPALLLLGAKIGSSFSLAVRFQVSRRSIPAVSFQRLMKGDARKKITHMLPQLPTSPTKETVESWDRNLVWLMKPCC